MCPPTLGKKKGEVEKEDKGEVLPSLCSYVLDRHQQDVVTFANLLRITRTSDPLFLPRLSLLLAAPTLHYYHSVFLCPSPTHQKNFHINPSSTRILFTFPFSVAYGQRYPRTAIPPSFQHPQLTPQQDFSVISPPQTSH